MGGDLSQKNTANKKYEILAQNSYFVLEIIHINYENVSKLRTDFVNNNNNLRSQVQHAWKKLERRGMGNTKVTRNGGIVFGISTVVLLSFLLMNNAISAQGDKKAGSDKARACQVCHGVGGKSTNPTYPRLAGQHAKYIIKQLKAFKAGTRKDPIMNGMASTLSEKDMEDVAAFFASNGRNH